jgi:glycosyltransferase involved in cell wall biosynthesis
MRIALLTSGRFWLVDLGRELAALGHDVRVYSLVPPHMTARFGLPKECNRWLGGYVAPQLALTRVVRTGAAARWANDKLLGSLDCVAARAIEPCDVLIALSGLAVRSVDAIKRKHGALTFLERGSRHILSQREILDRSPTAETVPANDVYRELAGYGLADQITVPASHVVESFVERGFPRERLFHNPFGVAVEMFKPTPPPSAAAQQTIIMTGTWSWRKGCDVLLEAWRNLPGVRLLHVGPVGDLPLPSDPGFEHVASVPQHKLPDYYAQAEVFALASREEGLALVQVQALASGLKVVCTTRTGGEDLQRGAAPGSIVAVQPDDPVQLAAALREALSERPPPGVARDRLGSARSDYSWTAYARRYEARILQALQSRPKALERAGG